MSNLEYSILNVCNEPKNKSEAYREIRKQFKIKISNRDFLSKVKDMLDMGYLIDVSKNKHEFLIQTSRTDDMRNWQSVFDYQKKLKSLFNKLLKKYNNLKLASDQPFRHWDLAIDISEEASIPMEVAIDIVDICHKNGARAAISNIHVNIWFGDYNKETMSLKVLDNLDIIQSSCFYIGDSPNDSPMFGCFPLSVGVKSVENYKDIMDNLPEYITHEDGNIGFIELVEFISSTR